MKILLINKIKTIMTHFYTDDELEELVTKLKHWSAYPIKELTELTKLSRVTVSKWTHNQGNVTVDNKMILWEAARKIISEKKRKWTSEKNKTSNV